VNNSIDIDLENEAQTKLSKVLEEENANSKVNNQ
jgi:hypothetical protein